MAKSSFHPLVEGYLSYIRQVCRRSSGTVRDVRCSLNKATEYMRMNHPGKELWHLDLESYMGFVGYERDQGKSETTLRKQICQIRGFLDYAWRNGRVDRNVLDGFNLKDSGKHSVPRVLSHDEAERLVESLSSKTKEARRDRMMVLLLYGCGLRTGELCSLNVQDIDHEKQELYIKQGKGHIQRRIPVPEGLWTELLAYLRERGGKLGALFKTYAKKKRINNHNVRWVVRDAVIRAGLGTDITAKTLRHSFATHLMDAGVDVGIIASLMGHKSPRETGVYMHALSKGKESAIDTISFKNNKEDKEQ